jgi:class 3 adenylate cyclase
MVEPLGDVAGVRTWREDLLDARFVQRRHIVRRDDPPGEDHDVVPATVSKLLHHPGEQGHVGSRVAGETDGVGIFLDRRLGDLLWSLVQARVDHLKPRVAQGASHHLGPAVVSVETRFRHDHAMLAGHRAESSERQVAAAPGAMKDAGVEPPETRYAVSDGVNIAYQVVGTGPFDLVYVPGWVSNVELMWEEPRLASFLQRLASFARLIVFDKRGTGLSDPVPDHQLPGLERRMDDVRAVMDAAGSERAALLGHSEGGNMCILFSASFPERTSALVLVGCYAKRSRSDDYPWAPEPEAREREIVEVERTWGRGDLTSTLAPSLADDPAFQSWFARYLRLSASPRAAAALLRMNTDIDTREVLPSIRVPSLLIYRTGDADVLVEEGRWLASQIPDARLEIMPGSDHLMWTGNAGAILDEIEGFLTGVRRGPVPDRVLTTVLFTDIVGSTERAAAMGDHEWSGLLERHHAVVRRSLTRFQGREVDTAGDGFLARFDGPARAVRCAVAAADAVHELGLQIRAGVHTGEVELVAEDVRGVAVHIGARIAGLAGPGQVLVSRTVKDLVAGSGLVFEDEGERELKGVPDPWHLYRVVEA